MATENKKERKGGQKEGRAAATTAAAALGALSSLNWFPSMKLFVY